MRISVIVEGPSDQAALTALLGPLIHQKAAEGVYVHFMTARSGDRKRHLMEHVPNEAADWLREDHARHMIVIPDLYPLKSGLVSGTPEELVEYIKGNFKKALARRGVDDIRLLERFSVFCFKHDLEVLVLAAREQLAEQLEASGFKLEWNDTVEDQNHNRPPKRVVMELFEAHGRKYRETRDAARILDGADYRTIAERCPQCFKPFVDFLTSLRPAP
ncbi:MAG TPA: DUF4276 family protein [Candidatus Kapabacteria bacterium]|nr:DUF4276 family protein [Candidatus Kapabacteria bacterium]